MNITAVAAALRAGVCSDPHRIAAVELVIEHEHWLDDPVFVTECVTWEDDHSEAWIVYKRALQLLESKELRGSTTQRLILLIAASLDGNVAPLQLSWLARLDDRNAELVHDAVGLACGRVARPATPRPENL